VRYRANDIEVWLDERQGIHSRTHRRGVSRIDALIAEIASGEYAPSTRSVGEKLLRSCGCPCHGAGMLARFARAALEAEGLIWVAWLEADPATLANDEAEWIGDAWNQWVDGRRPFSGRRHASR